MLLILPLLLPFSALAELEISDAWIKHLPASVPVRAGYMTLHNAQTDAQRIVAVSSDSFASVEIHESIMQDGMMRMEEQSGLTVEPGASVVLEPGGLHLMMMGPKQPTKPGETHPLRLEFEDGSEQQIEMKVKK